MNLNLHVHVCERDEKRERVRELETQLVQIIYNITYT